MTHGGCPVTTAPSRKVCGRSQCRHDGLVVSAASVLRLLRAEGLLLEANHQRERRRLAARRQAAFALQPTGPNQVWQLDFERHEALLDRVGVGDLRRRVVAATR